MELELAQLDCKYADLRVMGKHGLGQLVASLTEIGQHWRGGWWRMAFADPTRKSGRWNGALATRKLVDSSR